MLDITRRIAFHNRLLQKYSKCCISNVSEYSSVLNNSSPRNNRTATCNYLPKCLQSYRFFCSGQNKIISKEIVKKELKSYYEQNRDRLKDTEQKLLRKGNVILNDIKETKDKVREKVEEIIEVF